MINVIFRLIIYKKIEKMPGPIDSFKRGQIVALTNSGFGTRDISQQLNISVNITRDKNESFFQQRRRDNVVSTMSFFFN